MGYPFGAADFRIDNRRSSGRPGEGVEGVLDPRIPDREILSMATTHLFVELLVIGFGALAWIVLLFAAVFGYDISAIKDQLLPLGALFPILSLAYVFGILTDRVADWIFDWLWEDTQYSKIYGDEFKTDSYFEDRRTLVVESPELWQFIEYGRSRLRICRGWALNSLLLLLALVVYAALGKGAAVLRGWPLVFMGLALILLAFLCWKSWQKLNYKEYEKIRRQAGWVRKRLEENRKQEIELSGSLVSKRAIEDESTNE